jgi:acetyltransferase
MSIRHLDQLFDPASVAVIGASPRAGSVGATVWRNLRVWPICPQHPTSP